MKSDDLTLRTATTSASQLDQLYSTVQKPRPQPRRAVTPEGAVYTVPDRRNRQPPPPVAPKPSSRSPTPTSGERRGSGPMPPRLKVSPGVQRAPGLCHTRSESLDAGLLSSSSFSSSSSATVLRPEFRELRSHSLTQHNKVQRSPLADQRSPSPEVSTLREIWLEDFFSLPPPPPPPHPSPLPPPSQIQTFSSLPSSYRNRARIREGDINRARSNEELPEHRHHTSDSSPKLVRNLRTVAIPHHDYPQQQQQQQQQGPDPRYVIAFAGMTTRMC